MRLRLLSCALALAACSHVLRTGRDGIDFTTTLHPDTLMRIAETQLLHHGYVIGVRMGGAVTTTPRAVPQEARAGARGRAARRWVLRVDAVRDRVVGGTDVRVMGFLIPPGPASAAGALPAEATTVTAGDRQLFAEVEAVAGWIRDAAQRRARGGG